MPQQSRPGRIVRAPEHFVSASLQQDITQHGVGASDSPRRDFLRKSFLGAAAALAAGVASRARAADGAAGDDAILTPQPWATTLGQPVAAHPYGQPSPFEKNLVRRESPGLTRVSAASVSFAPLQGFFGIITPNGLHFERHHQGWQDIDPARHRLMINGLVKAPRVYTMDDLMRLPAVSRMHFIECGANTGMEWGNVAVPTVQYTHGMLSCCEFTGVPLKVLLDDAGADFKRGRYLLAEGGDGSGMTRTIAMALADEIIVAWGMNGEMLRPENGYPLRLVVPGVQGVSWVKWLRRLELGDQPWNTKDETVHYVDMMPDGMLRQYTSIQECKSVITTPSGGQQLVGRGFYNISGLAWSGRGRVKRVDVSVDGGRNWRTARLETPVLSKCLTRFNLDWVWDGSPAILQSRAIDETGYVQPRLAQLRAVRGARSIYHNNAIQSWQVADGGEVSNVHVD
ncbi:sulfite dehydrogenase [Cupriavidus basilensis]|uniref:Sulfur oxidation molybdopterin C protein n=1 Tax=Cupriavidus basilensis TaxID=68895 RepID=A0A0C4YET5_9BURK|nr:sulfite dehydrogenase [Cupriavidus basilensis]AJG21353.1 Sulfur oxidation molybdopterin C protein [Cupriavidus basilensis]